MIWAYPPEIEDFVREWCPKLRDQELAPLVNEKFGTEFTASSMKAYRGNHKIRNYQTKRYRGAEYWKFQAKYPQGMYEFIRDNSEGVSSEKMAEMVEEKFGYHFSTSGMKQFRARHKIRSGMTGWFQKDHASERKGMKIEEFMSQEGIEKSKEHRFKKGQRPPNWVPVGTQVKRDGIWYAKVQEEGYQWDRWKAMHRLIWERANGPIPKGHCVILLNGDADDLRLENLELITKAEAAAIQKYRSEFPEVTETAIKMVRLKLDAKEKKKSVRNTKSKDKAVCVRD